MRKRILYLVATIACLAGALPVSAISGDDLERLARAVVLVVPVEKRGSGYTEIGSSGSGTIVDNKIGIIITNHHVVYNDAKRASCKFAYISVAMDVAKTPERCFLFEVVVDDAKLDLAVLRYVEKVRGCKVDLADLPFFSPAPGTGWGRVDDLKLNDEIIIMGYPGYDVSSDKALTITITNGKVSGFLPDPDYPGTEKAWIKSDALASWGNSGGTAIDSAGRFIGIPTEVMLDKKGGRLALFRPVDMVRPFLARVMPVSPGPSPSVAKPATPPGPSGAKPAASAAAPLVPSLTGSVVTALAKRPVKGARLTVLKPQYRVRDYMKSHDASMVLCFIEADAQGRFSSTQNFTPGQSYALVVTAEGYKTYMKDNGITVPDSPKGPLTLKIELSRE